MPMIDVTFPRGRFRRRRVGNGPFYPFKFTPCQDSQSASRHYDEGALLGPLSLQGVELRRIGR